MFLDHGVNFGGTLNLFGGFTEKHEQRIEALLYAQRLYSLDIPMPDYAKMLASRKDVKNKEMCERLAALQKEAVTLRSVDLGLDWLTIGDSHTAAFAPFDSMVVKENGRTLHGQVTTDFAYVREYLAECPQIRGVTMVFGNIDVRHHICRLGADWKHLYREWKRFGDSLDIEVEYSLPWPAEFEGRRLPKTGWYKGQPFWGTQEERAEVIRGVWGFAGEIGMNVVRYPEEWLDMDPEIYAKERMEKPQSVHLSPEFYRRHEWRAVRG